MIVKWQRGVPVYAVPLVSGPFLATAAVAATGLALIVYRLIAGLAATTGMTDAYAWGIWKTFNVMVLTALGSGSFAIGLAAWIFKKRALHSVMRVALLISFLVYATGLLAIMDVIEQTSLTLAINEAWLMLAAITALALALLWVMGPIRGSPPPRPGNHKLG